MRRKPTAAYVKNGMPRAYNNVCGYLSDRLTSTTVRKSPHYVPRTMKMEPLQDEPLTGLVRSLPRHGVEVVSNTVSSARLARDL
jgi:hypothetical protein